MADELSNWLSTQLKNYKNKQHIMSNEKIYDKWTEFINNNKYNKYFISNEDEWYNKLEFLKKYIDDNNKRPLEKSKNEKELSKWMSHQITNYKSKTESMKDSEIYNKFSLFLNEYSDLFQSNEEKWSNTLGELKNYINNNQLTPSEKSKNLVIKKLGQWIGTQKRNYKNKTKIMKNPKIHQTWTEFITSAEYSQYFT